MTRTEPPLRTDTAQVPEPPPNSNRRALMRRIRGRDTKPELSVRRLLHRLGYRYRLHAGDLPGRPDVVFRRRRKAIFIHGCFWHQHEGCKRATVPKTRTAYWCRKFEANRARDRASLQDLDRMGWTALVVWECETRAAHALSRRLTCFLEEAGRDVVVDQPARHESS